MSGKSEELMPRSVLVVFFILAASFQLRAQALTVETYSQELFFNIFRDQPDTSIRPFLRLYTPSLLAKNENLPAPAGKPSLEVHSYIFTKHPFFNASFTNGRLELFCQRYPEPRGVQVFDVKLWFEFDTQEEAETAYSKLIQTFSPIATQQKKFSVSGAIVAQFTDTKGTKGFNKVQIRLTADNLDRRHFKILFENNNDLD